MANKFILSSSISGYLKIFEQLQNHIIPMKRNREYQSFYFTYINRNNLTLSDK